MFYFLNKLLRKTDKSFMLVYIFKVMNYIMRIQPILHKLYINGKHFYVIRRYIFSFYYCVLTFYIFIYLLYFFYIYLY